ncbi:sodium:solute symporter [Ponticaulis sp.]|uniref:sodium:solute symporter n=1 Tax=Ponticaulis sp. TaxID=2020902 RepID=UPI0025CC7205|nr:sodium:solute symporter [Ponticaulis sp.]
MATLTLLDWSVIAGYFAIVIIIGWVVSRNMKSGEDLFLAGRSLGFATIGFSLFASNISSTTLIGVSGQAYASGISVASYELMAGILLAIMAFTTIPVFLRIRITTIPEFFGRRFGPTAQRYFSGVTLFLTVFVDMAASVYAGVVVLQAFFPAIPFVPMCIALAAFAGLYTAAGGLRAVVYTDVLQAIVLLIGAAGITSAVFSQFGFDWNTAQASLPDGHLSIVRPADDAALPWPGLILGVPILGWFYWSSNQYVMQRVLGAKDMEQARRGASFAGLLKILPVFVMAIPGALAFSLIPGLENSDLVFPTLIADFLPAGMTGLVLAGLIAAIMSTVDSTLNSASTLMLYDFLKVSEKNWSEKKILNAGRMTTAGLITIAALWPLVIREFPGVFGYIQQVFGYAVPPVVAVMTLALFWKGVTGRAAIATLIIGHLIGAATFAYRAWCVSTGTTDVLPHFLMLSGYTTIFLVILCAGISFADKKSMLPTTEDVWKLSDLNPMRDRKLLLDYRLHAPLVLFACLFVIWLFR